MLELLTSIEFILPTIRFCGKADDDFLWSCLQVGHDQDLPYWRHFKQNVCPQEVITTGRTHIFKYMQIRSFEFIFMPLMLKMKSNDLIIKVSNVVISVYLISYSSAWTSEAPLTNWILKVTLTLKTDVA